MSERTMGEIWRERDQLEAAAAAALGRVLLAYSRLDRNITMYVASFDDGTPRDQREKRCSAMALHDRLNVLAKRAEKSFSSTSPGGLAYADWVAAAGRTRLERNRLFHSSWHVEVASDVIINLVGVGDEAEKSRRQYSIADINRVTAEIEGLHCNLNTLVRRWPM